MIWLGLCKDAAKTWLGSYKDAMLLRCYQGAYNDATKMLLRCD